MNERKHWNDLVVDGKITLEWILTELEWEDVDWMHLAKDGEQWRAPLNRVMNIQVP
jgi:hypothetical protein